MFEQLFGSKTRVKLMQVFLENPGKKFYVRELTRMTDSLINSVRRELDNLVKLKLVVAEDLEEKAEPQEEEVVAKTFNAKKFYVLNPNNLIHRDLLNLFSKGKMLIEKRLIEKLKDLGDVQYLAFGGLFVDDSGADTDILIIGQYNKSKAKEIIDQFEKEIERPVRYTLFDSVEYNLRMDIADKFLAGILKNERNMVLINRLEEKE